MLENMSFFFGTCVQDYIQFSHQGMKKCMTFCAHNNTWLCCSCGLISYTFEGHYECVVGYKIIDLSNVSGSTQCRNDDNLSDLSQYPHKLQPVKDAVRYYSKQNKCQSDVVKSREDFEYRFVLLEGQKGFKFTREESDLEMERQSVDAMYDGYGADSDIKLLLEKARDHELNIREIVDNAIENGVDVKQSLEKALEST